MDTFSTIIGVLALVALVYAWYTERTRRRQAELDKDLAYRRVQLDATGKKLEENKVAFDQAKKELDGSIAPDMLKYLGEPLPNLVPDVRSGRLVDTRSGIVSEAPGPAIEPVESKRWFDLGADGKAKAPH